MNQNSAVLNLLRTTAIALVVIDHLCETLAPFHPYDWYLGRLGVLLFFVHTSCVLMMSLARTPLTGMALAAHFYVRRAFRIYPLSLLTVALVVVFRVPPVAWGPDPPISALGVVAANLFLVQDLVGVASVISPLWSLPLEMQMYVLLPAVFLFIRRGSSLSRAAALWAGGLAIGVAAPWLSVRLAVFVPCFLSGVVGFCLSTRVRPRVPHWLWPLALAGLIGAYVGMAQLSREVHPAPVAWAVCLATGLLLPHFQETSSGAKVVPERIAKYSYGIYLAHMITLFVAFRVLDDHARLVQWIVFVSLTMGISVAVFHLVETPFIRVGTRVADRLRIEHL